jgi:hypothetical protein
MLEFWNTGMMKKQKTANSDADSNAPVDGQGLT